MFILFTAALYGESAGYITRTALMMLLGFWWTVGVTVSLASFPGHCLLRDVLKVMESWAEHWQFQARMPGSNSGQLWLFLTETRSGSATCITYQGNFAALKPLTHVNKATVCIIDSILAGRSSISIAGSVYWGVHAHHCIRTRIILEPHY